MKNSLRLTSARHAFGRMLLAGIMIATSANLAHATTYYWDQNGTTAGSGVGTATATWASTTKTWNTDSTGGSGGSVGTTAPTSSDDVVFSAGTDASATYGVTVSGSVSTKGITLNTNGSGILNMGGTGASLTIGSDGLTVNGGASTSTTTVLKITTGSSGTGSLTIGSAQTWSIANGNINVLSNINYAAQLTFGSGTFIIGSTGGGPASYGGAGGVRINGGDVQITTISTNNAVSDFGTGALELSSGSMEKWGANSGSITIANATTIDGSFTFGQGGTKPLTFTNSVTIQNAPTITLNNGGGTNFNGSTTLQSNVTFAGIPASGGVTTFTNGISDDGHGRSVSYTSGGRYNLLAGSTYTGGTTISGGTVVAANTSGSATGFGSLLLNGGVLAGGGTFTTSGVTSGTAVTISSGTLSPSGGTGVAVMTYNLQGNTSMQLNSGAKFVFDLNTINASDNVTNGTATSDLIRITGGTLNLNSIDLTNFTFNLGANFNDGYYNLFATDAPGDITGTLGSTLTQAFTLNGQPYSYTLAITNNGQDLTLEVIPEPSTWALMLGGLGVLVYCVRRRNLSGNSRV